MKRAAIIMTVLMLAGCLATDPAVREAKRQDKLSFREAVSNLMSLNAGEKNKFRCKSLGQVLGKGGMAPRSYDDDLKQATIKARQQVVRSGGNAIMLISSLLSPKFPREVVVIAEALDCGKIPKSTYKPMELPAPVKAEPVKAEPVNKIPETDQTQ